MVYAKINRFEVNVSRVLESYQELGLAQTHLFIFQLSKTQFNHVHAEYFCAYGSLFAKINISLYIGSARQVYH